MQKYINDLVLTGLTENEAKTYLLLLEKPLSAARIAQRIGVNRSNIYGIISSLVQKGFLREMNGKSRTILAINPEIAFNTNKTALTMRIKLMDRLAAELQPYYKADCYTENKELIKILHTKSVIIDTLEKLELAAEEEVLAFSKPPYLMNVDNLAELNTVQGISAQRGVVYRAIHEIEPDNMDNFLKRMQYFSEMGEEVRLADQLPMKMFIFDRKIAVFTLENNLNNFSDYTFTSFEHSDVAITFTQIFQQYWEKAITLADYLNNKEMR